jgi:SAM-dependent methyltransferase
MNASGRLQQRRNSVLSRAYLVYRALWPPLAVAARKAAAECGTSGQPLVIDVGCGEKPYADFFQGASYVALNYCMDGASPDIVGDAQQLPLKSDCADIVFSTQVIEHVPHPEKLIQEAFRVLKPCGVLLLTGPFYWPLHEEPHDFYRFTRYGFEHLLTSAGFEVMSIRGDAGAVTQAAVALIEVLPRPLLFLVPVINIVTPLLQRFSRNEKSTLNYIALAKKP